MELKQGQLLEKDVSQKCTAKPERLLHYKLYYTTLGERAAHKFWSAAHWESCKEHEVQINKCEGFPTLKPDTAVKMMTIKILQDVPCS